MPQGFLDAAHCQQLFDKLSRDHLNNLHVPPPPQALDSDDTQPTLPPISIAQLDDTQPIKVHKKAPRRRRLMILALVIVVFLSVLVGGTIVAVMQDAENSTSPTSIILQIDGMPSPVQTESNTVGELLRELELVLESGDAISPGLNEPLADEMVIRIDRARTVSLTVDGRTSILRTTFDSPLDILRLVGQEVRPVDRVVLDGTETEVTNLALWPVPVTDIIVERAVNVTIYDGEVVTNLATTAETVGDALFEAGITLFLADSVTPEVSTAITEGLEITVDRSRPVQIVADGTQIETRVNAATVNDALAEAGVVLAGLDYTVPREDTEILPGMLIRVIRVREEFVTEQDVLNYQTQYQADNSMELDQRAVIQAGQNGVIQRTIRVRYENDIEISREVAEEIQSQALRDQIIAYGTQVVMRTVNTSEGPREYWRKLRVYATSYKPESVGGSTTTAVGETLRKGIIGVNPHIISYYTNMYVEGYGVGFAADTGGPRTFSYWIDLGYSDEDYEGWHQWVDVYLLGPVPDTVNYLLPIEENGGPVP